MKQKLFSITKKDLIIDWFSGSGAGGQHRNKHMNCCRITHPESGAVGIGQTERSQEANKKTALQNLIKTSEFNSWVKLQAAMVSEGYANIEKKLDSLMNQDNIKVEVGVDCIRKEDICDKDNS